MPTHAQIDSAITTPINEDINNDTTAAILSTLPFVQLPGSFNSREVQGSIRPGYAFRSGTLERLEEPGFERLKQLGIQTVFDLRSIHETTKNPLPGIPGIEIVWQPSTLDNQTEPPKLDTKFGNVYEMNISMFESHQTAFRVVLRHVLEHPERPFLFHCTAGKDRTGVLAALLHALAGTPIEAMQRDYGLTRVGIEPAKDYLMGKLAGGGRKLDLNDPSVQQAAGFKHDAMARLVADLDEKYGSVVKYAETSLGFTTAEIEKIQQNLTRR